jgi:DNA polymerase-3 subunit epsilon
MMSALAKLKLKAWPYSGPVGLVERDDFLDLEEIHLVDHWRYLGTAKSENEVDELLAHAGQVQFDRDTYRLLQSHLAKGKVSVRRF